MSYITLVTSIITVKSDDEDVRRRGRNLIILSLGLILLAVVVMTSLLLFKHDYLGVASGIPALIIQTAVIIIARRGAVTSAALILIIMTLLGLFVTQLTSIDTASITLFLLIPVLIATVTLRPYGIVLVFVGTVIAIVLLSVLLTTQNAVSNTDIFTITGYLCFFAMLVGLLSSSTSARAWRESKQARAAAEQASAALAVANTALEAWVSERTAALQTALTAQQTQAHELQVALATQQQLNQIVMDLSLPIIPVRSDVLVAPLIGTLDSARLERSMNSILKRIEIQRARVIILDVTGVPIIDPQVAAALLRLARAARLLGARPVLVGVRPEVAQTLVSLGVEFSSLETCATLQQGLEQL